MVELLLFNILQLHQSGLLIYYATSESGWPTGELHHGICLSAKNSMAIRVIELGRLAELT